MTDYTRRLAEEIATTLASEGRLGKNSRTDLVVSSILDSLAPVDALVEAARGAGQFVRDLGCIDPQCDHPECVASKSLDAALVPFQQEATK